MGLLVICLPFKPLLFNGLVFAVFDELVYYIVNLEADLERLVTNHYTFCSIEIAYEACLFKDEVVFKTRLTERMSTKS